MSDKTWKTAISDIKPNEVRLRGYRIDELMGRVDFGQAFYLLLRGELVAYAGQIIHHNDPQKVIQDGEEALAYLPEEDQVPRARVYMTLGTAYSNNNELQKAMVAYQAARDLALSAKAPFLATVTIELSTEIQMYHQGRLKVAAENLAHVLELGKLANGSHQPFTGLAHSLLGTKGEHQNQKEGKKPVVTVHIWIPRFSLR